MDEDEIKAVRASLESTPLIKEALGNDWIDNNLLNVEERTIKHSLFWLFLDAAKIQKMENWLTIARSCIPDSKFNKIINSIKERRSEKDFFSLVSELEVLAYYGSNGIAVEYEPNIPEKENIGDIKLTVDSTEIYIEITRLFESRVEERVNSLVHSVTKRIDAIPNNPFIITLVIDNEFCPADLEPFIELVNDEIAKNRDILEPMEGKPYIVEFGSKATIFFHKKISHRKGYVGGSILPVTEIKSASRLKNKILDKPRQLPDAKLNIVAIDISQHFTDFEDVENAFIGQLGYVINRQTSEGRIIRNSNGVIHTADGRKVGLTIAFKGFNYEQRRKYVNLLANIPFKEEILTIL